MTTVVHLVATMRDGGAEALLRTLVPRLAAEPDLDVHVVSVYDPRLTADEATALGATLHAVGRRGRTDVAFAPRLIGTLRRLRPQVVHAHLHTGKYAGRIAALAAGVPAIVFTEHGDEAGGTLRRGINRILHARTARFVVFTEAERRAYAEAEDIPLERIAVIPNAIEPAQPFDRAAMRAELGIEPGMLAIASAARLVHQKNQELALHAIAALRRRGRNRLRLLVAGDGPDAAALHALAAELQLSDAVRFLGYRTDARAIVAASDLLVLPSLWEKMPLVLGEAMLAGIPVVSTPWTGVDAFIADGRTGYLAEDWSIAAFAAALSRALDDPLHREAIAAQAKAFARETFDLARAVRSHAQLYRSLASEGHA